MPLATNLPTDKIVGNTAHADGHNTTNTRVNDIATEVNALSARSSNIVDVTASPYSATGNARAFTTAAGTSSSGTITSQLATPTGVSATPSTTGGVLTAGTRGYRVSAYNDYGETLAASTVTATTTGSTSSVTVSWTAVAGASGYQIYGRTSGSELLMQNIVAPRTSWIDTGALDPEGSPLPSSNTTGPFTSGMVGRSVYLSGGGAAGAQYAGSVTGFTSASQITVSPNLSTTLVAGATGTVGTNDSAAIAAAVAALPSGGTLHFPAGQYLDADGVTITGKSNITVSGDHATIIGGSENSTVMSIVNSAQVAVSQLRVQHATTTARSGAFGLLLKWCRDVDVTDVHVFRTCAAGIYLEAVTRGTVSSSTVRANLADGIHVTGASTDINILGNRVFDCGDDGIAFVSYRADGAQVQRFTATGNTVYRAKARGISVIGSGNGAVVGNTVAETTAAGIIVAQETSFSTYGPSDVLVADNTIISAVTYNGSAIDHGAIHINGQDSAYPVTGVVISGNYIKSPRRTGLIADSNIDNLTVDNNVFTGPSAENVDTFVLANTVTGTRLRGNRISYSNGNAIINFGATNVLIDGNEIYYPQQSGGGGYGIRIDSGTARLINNIVRPDPGKTALTSAILASPTAAAVSGSTGAGTTPPAPVITTGSTDEGGSLTFGTGSGTVGTGAYVTVTFHCPFGLTPKVAVVPTNTAAAARQPYITNVTTTSFQIGLGTAATASQANTTYGIAWTVAPA